MDLTRITLGLGLPYLLTIRVSSMARPDIVKLAMNPRSNGLRLALALGGVTNLCRRMALFEPMAHSAPAGVAVPVFSMEPVQEWGVPRWPVWDPVNTSLVPVWAPPGQRQGPANGVVLGTRLILLFLGPFRPYWLSSGNS